MASAEVATILQLSPPAPTRPRRPLAVHACLSSLGPRQSRARGRRPPGDALRVSSAAPCPSRPGEPPPATSGPRGRTRSRPERRLKEAVPRSPTTRAGPGQGRGRPGVTAAASAPLLPWKPGPAVHPAGTRPPGCRSARGAGGAWVSLGPRPSPAYGGHAARLGLPRWGPGARRSQLRGHETQTVTRSGLRFRGRTAIPARKREC